MSKGIRMEEKDTGHVNVSYDEETMNRNVSDIQKEFSQQDSLHLVIPTNKCQKECLGVEISYTGIHREPDKCNEQELQTPESSQECKAQGHENKKSFSLDRKWIVLVACFVAQSFSIGFVFSIPVILVYILNEYGGSKAETSVIFSALIGSFYMSGFFIGVLINKSGPGLCGIAGSLLATISLSISFFANGILFLTISLGAFLGLGLSLSFISSSTCVGLYFTSDKSKLMALSFLSFGSGIGSMVFPYVLSQLSREYGWKGCLLIGGAIVFNMVPCFAVCQPFQTPNTTRVSVPDVKHTYPSDISAPNQQHEVTSATTKIKSLAKSKIFCTYALGHCFFLPAVGQFIQFFVDFLQNTKGFDEDTAILLYFVLNLSSTIARILPGFCKKFIPGFSVLMVPIIYICIGIVAFLLFPGATTLLQHGILTCATGLMLGGAISSTSVTTMKLVDYTNYSIALGLILFLIGIGILSAGPIAGYLRDVTGNYTLGIYLSTASLCVSLCFFLSSYVIRSKGCRHSKTLHRRESSRNVS